MEGIRDACHVWAQELKGTFRDEGVLIFFIIVPIAYPLLYSWIYNNEVVHEVPVAVVDDSHSAMSRMFVRRCDASPDVSIKYHAGRGQSYAQPPGSKRNILHTVRLLYKPQPHAADCRKRVLRHESHADLQGCISDGNGCVAGYELSHTDTDTGQYD